MSEVVPKDPKDPNDPKNPKNHNFIRKEGVITCTFIPFLGKECEYKCSQYDHPGFHCDKECLTKCSKEHKHCHIKVYGNPCGLLYEHEHCDRCGEPIIDNYHLTDCR